MLSLDATAVPDVLAETSESNLLGQDELGDREIAVAVDAVREALTTKHLRAWFGETLTECFVEQKTRLRQHRFANAVLYRYDRRCGFCGFYPRGLENRGLLLASHIKAWARCSSDHERFDPRNGIAACPTHDGAFEAGLLTVNGGLPIHRARNLVASLAESTVQTFSGADVLRASLLLGASAEKPAAAYLDYHKTHVFERTG